MQKKSKSKNSKVSIKIPQMGEGLREVKIIKLLKKPGDFVQKDEIIFEMETDKSAMEIESAYSGVLNKWIVEEGETIPVGEIIGYIESASTHEVEKQFISPRTRSYGRKLGLTITDMQMIPKRDSKLMPEDIDLFLKINQESRSTSNEVSLSSQQKLLMERFKRSQQKVISASLTSIIDMDLLKKAIFDLIKENKLEHTDLFISEFQVFSYLISKVSSKSKLFRSILINENKVRTSEYLNLGIAVYTTDNQLVTAVIEKANSLTFLEFIKSFQKSVSKALEGYDQAKLSPHIVLSYMGENGGLFGSPLLVEPSVATIYLGKTLIDQHKSFAYISLTFDHRLINGMEAIAFLNNLSITINNAKISSLTKRKVKQIDKKIFSISDLHQWLLRQITNLLKMELKQIDLNSSLGLQGMDSLKAVELIKSIEKTCNLSLSPTILWHYSTFNTLFGYLVKHLNLQDNKKVDIDQLVAEIQSLPKSDFKDVLQFLNKKSKQ